MSFYLEISELKKGEKVELPFSKSLANRILIITSLAGSKLPEISEVEPEDTVILRRLLNSESNQLNSGDAGTVMRFMTAFCSVQKGDFLLDGSERMRQRPIGILVETLRKQGIEIEYLNAEGYPPLKVTGGKLKGGEIDMDADVSSQYISALMLIAPFAENSIKISLKGKILSLPYIEMTAKLMRKAGINVEIEGSLISIQSGEYKLSDEPQIERDWSSAAFVYSFFACSDLTELFLPELSKRSIQGDKACAELFEKLSVVSTERQDGIMLTKTQADLPAVLEFDFKDTPDLVQAFTICCAVLGVELKLSGLDNLSIKETDRLSALKFNLEQLGMSFNYEHDRAQLHPAMFDEQKSEFKSFGDHRMIMSLVSVLPRLKEMKIDDISFVNKSFPEFFNQLKNFGVTVNEKP